MNEQEIRRIRFEMSASLGQLAEETGCGEFAVAASLVDPLAIDNEVAAEVFARSCAMCAGTVGDPRSRAGLIVIFPPEMDFRQSVLYRDTSNVYPLFFGNISTGLVF